MQPWTVVRAASGAVVVLAIWAGAAGPASALETPRTGDCDAVLVDAADELTSSEEAEVADAAAAFRSETSFEPRVWILTQDQDGPDLSTWIGIQTEACDSWHAGNSLMTSNFVVLAVTTDSPSFSGETYLWYGDAMPSAMDEQFTVIQSDVMNPALRDGDFVRGLTEGLAAVKDVIDPGPPTGLIVAGGIVVLGGAGIGGYQWRRRRLQRAQARAALAERFEAAAAGSDQAVLRLDPIAESLNRDVQLVRASFHEDEVVEQLADDDALLATYATLTAQRLDLAVARDQVLRDADDETLARVVTAWEELRGKTDELVPALAHERDELTSSLRLPESIPSRVYAVPAAVELVRAAERTAREQGFTPTSEVAPLASVPARVAEAERLAAERRYLAADRELTSVEVDLEASRVALNTLPERLADLTARVEQAEGRRMALGPKIDTARTALATLRADFNPAIADQVGDAAGAAAEHAARADAALADARTGLGIRDLGAVGTAVIAAEDALAQGETAANAPPDVLTRVRACATELPAALTSVRQSLEALAPRIKAGSTEAATHSALHGRASAITLAGEPDWLALEPEIRAIGQGANELGAQVAAAERAEAQRRAAAAAERNRKRSSGGGFGSFLGGSGGSSSSRSSGSSSSGGSRSSSSSSSGGSRSGGGGSRSSGSRGGGGSRR